jgi:hypothetical protein
VNIHTSPLAFFHERLTCSIKTHGIALAEEQVGFPRTWKCEMKRVMGSMRINAIEGRREANNVMPSKGD